MSSVATFLMFTGQAEEAINCYVSLIPNSAITAITRYEEGEPGKASTVKHASFSLNGQQYMAIDSFVQHQFTFTPAMSIYVACDGDDEVDKLYNGLAEGGSVLMPLGAYPFSKRYAWLADRFGVSWQLSSNKS